MSGIRSQEVKIGQLAQESDRARIECKVRAEPPMAWIRGIATGIQTAGTLRDCLGRVVTNGPRKPYLVIAATFAASLLIPCLLGRFGPKD